MCTDGRRLPAIICLYWRKLYTEDKSTFYGVRSILTDVNMLMIMNDTIKATCLSGPFQRKAEEYISRLQAMVHLQALH